VGIPVKVEEQKGALVELKEKHKCANGGKRKCNILVGYYKFK